MESVSIAMKHLSQCISITLTRISCIRSILGLPQMRDRLHDAGELLYRQIRKDQIDEGQPGSHAFRPLPKDRNMLSLDRGALTTPREAHALFIENGFES